MAWLNAHVGQNITDTVTEQGHGSDFFLSQTKQKSPLTPPRCVGIIANMEAELIHSFKSVAASGEMTELVVWRLPQPVPPSTHCYKYRAAYIVERQRVIGFDNERGKGDHRHSDGQEFPYSFTTVEQLVEDFIAAIAARRKP